MGSAWYPRREVEALRPTAARPPGLPRRSAFAGWDPSPTAERVRWPDDALITLLREKPRTVVDLVVDAGIPISRAERVYRFWRQHERMRTATSSVVGASEPPERRSGERIEHDALVRQLRDADPKIRAAAFEKLKAQRR
jgi:hypothetical protein